MRPSIWYLLRTLYVLPGQPLRGVVWAVYVGSIGLAVVGGLGVVAATLVGVVVRVVAETVITLFTPNAVLGLSRAWSGEVVDFVRFRWRDRAALADIYLDPHFAEVNGWPDEQVGGFVLFIRHMPLTRLFLRDHVALRERATGRIVGTASATQPPEAVGSPARDGAAVGLTIATEDRGRGLATAALRELTAVIGGRRTGPVVMGTATTNTGMVAAAERAGGRMSATFPHTLPDGSTIDSVWFALGSE